MVQPGGDDLGRVGDGHYEPPPGLPAAPRPPRPSAARSGLGLGHGRPLGGHPVPDRPRRPSVRRTRLRVPWSGMSAARAPDRQLGHQQVEGLRGLGPDEAVVDLDAGGPVAVGQALGLLQGDGPVGGGAPGVDPERGLGVLQQLGRPVRAGRRCWCTPPPRGCPPARCGACRRRRRCRTPRSGVTPTRSAMSAMASGVSQPSCSWARWQRGMRAERGSG